MRTFDEAADKVRALLFNGTLRPGDRLPAERELSALLGISRPALREALRALELAGMIESRKGAAGGAFVRPGNAQVVVGGMRDLYHLGAITPEHLTEARIWLSEMVVRVVCVPDSGDGRVSLGFVTALQDTYALRKTNNSASLGVGALGSVSLPVSASSESMVKVGSETISKDTFYESFFDLVRRYLVIDQDPS